jgi:hypothetical protein
MNKLSKFLNKKVFSVLVLILIVIGVAAILRHQKAKKEMALYMLYEEKKSDTYHSVVYGSLQKVLSNYEFYFFFGNYRLILEKTNPMQVGYIAMGDLQEEKPNKFD